MCQSRAAAETDNVLLAELVRFALRGQICFQVAGMSKVLPVLLIDSALEQALRERLLETNATYRLALNEEELARLVSVLDHYAGQIDRPGSILTLLAAPDIRRQVALALKNAGRATPVLSHEEVAPDFRIEVVGSALHDWIFPEQRSPKARPYLTAIGS
jgi:type III secretion protein V